MTLTIYAKLINLGETNVNNYPFFKSDALWERLTYIIDEFQYKRLIRKKIKDCECERVSMKWTKW